ncbi:uncharacterized protein LOC144451265 [Glandiceps talaboti]
MEEKMQTYPPPPPGPQVVVVNPSQPKDWENGLFGCFKNCNICILTFFCPCIVAGQNAAAVGDSCLVHAVCFFFFAPFLHCLLGGGVRSTIRNRNNIPGSKMMDYCLHLFCVSCSLCQEAAELKSNVVQPGPAEVIVRS